MTPTPMPTSKMYCATKSMKTRQHLQMNEIYANAPLAQNPYNTEYSK
jgi:hypothetical protein